MTDAFRKPAVFRADDPRMVLSAPEEEIGRAHV